MGVPSKEICGICSMPRHIGRAVVYKDPVENEQVVKASGAAWCSLVGFRFCCKQVITVACYFSKPIAKGLSMYSRKKPCLGWEGLQ